MPLAHLLRQNRKPGTGSCGAMGVGGNRASHLPAPSKPFPQSQALSASPTPRLSLSPQPRSYSLFLCLRTLTSRNQEERIDREVRGRKGGWGDMGTARGQGGQERGGEELSCPCDPSSGHSGAPQGWSIQSSQGGHLGIGAGWGSQSVIFLLSLVQDAEEGELAVKLGTD